MKKLIAILSLLTTSVLAQDCDCPSCREAAASGQTFSLPALAELNQPNAHEGHEHATQAKEVEEAHHHAEGETCGGHESAEIHDEHAGHDHSAQSSCSGHEDHEESELQLAPGMAAKIGLQVKSAQGGPLQQLITLPAEITLNRDQTATVSARYASSVRQVFAEIGDVVNKGDVLASLENRDTLAVYTVAAPLDGLIIAKNIARGETADPDRQLFEVADLSSVWADISVFPKYQHALRKGLPVTFVAHDGHTAQGSIKYVSPIISRETRTFTARCVLQNPSADFTPGAFVRARVTVKAVQASVRIERAAVQTIEGESVVFITDEHGYETRPVELGLHDDTFVEILSGLSVGEKYVARGAFTLKAEMVTSGMDPHAGHGH